MTFIEINNEKIHNKPNKRSEFKMIIGDNV